MQYGAQLFGSIDDLRDVDEALKGALESSSEIAFVALTAPSGGVIASEPMGFPIEEVLQRLQRSEVRQDPLFSLSRLLDALHQSLFDRPLLVAPPENSRQIDGFLITTVPIGTADDLMAVVHIGLEIEDFREIRSEMIFDTASVFIVTVLVGAECLILLWAVSIEAPMRIRMNLTKRLADRDLTAIMPVGSHGWSTELVRTMNAFIRQAVRKAKALASDRGLRLPPGTEPATVHYSAIGDIRLPLFLFCLGEGILRPSMPGYLAALEDTFGMGGEVQAAVAVSIFFLATLLGVTGSRAVTVRFGQRAVFLLGALLGAAGILAHTVAQTGLEGMAARALSGFGYGLVFGAAQAFVAAHTPPRRKARGLSLFVMVVVSAEIAGPAVGGVLSDQLGVERMIAFAAMVASFSLIAAYLILPGRRDGLSPPSVQLFKGGLVLTDIRLLLMMICFSVPTRILMTGGLFVLVPFAVADLGASDTEAGRVLMCSGLAVLASSGMIAAILERSRGFGSTIFVGAGISGLAFTVPILFEGLVGMFVAVIVFGLGHAITILAQPGFLALTQKSRVEKTGMASVTAHFQAWERLGAAIGPLIAAVLLALCPPTDGLFLMGVGAFVAMGIGGAYFLTVGEADEDEAIDALFVQR
ncbi:MAG: MFS transporter [Pseudomonadota bacterium]